MTDEQIRQNAEKYAKQFLEPYDEEYAPIKYVTAQMAHIEGAHSRDNEIEILQNQIDELSEQLKMNAENIQKLLNPWISVKERLPNYPESEYDIDNTYLVRREGGSIAFPAIFRRNGKWYIYDNMQAAEIIAPDYWMPMSKLMKGE